MKFLISLSILLSCHLAWSANSSLDSWPSEASELTDSQILKIQERLPNITRQKLVGYEYSNSKPTVGEHGIVTYMKVVLVTCDDGVIEEEPSYLVLYVENQSIRIATHFTSYACHID